MLSDTEILLHIHRGKNSEELVYIADQLLNFAGVHAPMRVRFSTESGLHVRNELVLDEDRLMELFRTLSLKREIDSAGKDRHGRALESAFAMDSETPCVQIAAEKIRQSCIASGIRTAPRNDHFQVLLTHDIDWVTGFELFSIMKSIRNTFLEGPSRWIPLRSCFSADYFLEGLRSMIQLEADMDVRSCFFMLSGPYQPGRFSSRYDCSWKTAKKFIREIIQSRSELGLHGSYEAGWKNSYEQERLKLEKVSGRTVRIHRNHYLRFDPIRFWSQLDRAGIRWDSSVGFVKYMGFRSGVAQPYRPYDFEKKRKSSIVEIPLVMMDRYPQLDHREEVIKSLAQLIMQVKKVSGCVAILFHPENMVVEPDFYSFYREVLLLLKNIGADLSGKLPDITSVDRDRYVEVQD